MKIVDNILQPAREQAYISHTITGGKIMATKTINLTGAEVAVTGLDGAHAHIRNDGTEVIYAAKTAGITAGADGVASIPAGQSDTIRGISGAVYLLGTGSVLIQSDDYVASPFKTSAASGGSGADEVARTAINTHAGNDEIHVTAEEKAAWDGKAELTDIPTALPADGGNADTVDGKHSYEITPYHPVNGRPYSTLTARIENVGNEVFKTILRNDDGTISATANFAAIADGGNADTVNGNDIEMSIYRSTSSFGTSNTDTADTIWQALPPSSIFAIEIQLLTDPSWNFPAGTNQYSLLMIKLSNVRPLGMYLCPKSGGYVFFANVDANGAYAGNWRRLCDGGDAATLGTHPASDFALKSEYDALAARVAALEGGTT